MASVIKTKARQFIKEYGIDGNNEQSFIKAIEKLGYTVIKYNSIYNEENVATVIDNLGLNERIEACRGFTFANENYRLVFVNEDLSPKETVIVLAHEIGHIVCNHLGTKSVIGEDVKQEHEANEFAHYLLHSDNNFFARNKLIFICVISAIVVIGLGAVLLTTADKSNEKKPNTQKTVSTVQSEGALLTESAVESNKVSSTASATQSTDAVATQSTDGTVTDYYVTTKGAKYHRKDCMYIKNKTNKRALTTGEYNSGKYKLCEACLPEDK